MINLIKMDLYRLFRTKALKVGVIAAFAVAAAAMLLNYAIVEVFKTSVANDPESAATMGMLIPAVGWVAGVDFADIVITGTSALSLLISCVVAASFISTEQTCGYVKNVIGQVSDRGYTVASKFVATSVIHFIILAVYTLVNVLLAEMLFGKYIVSYSIEKLVGLMLTRLLLYIAINAVILFLCILAKSQSLAMVIGAIFGTGITMIVYLVSSSVLGMLKIELNVSNYMPDGINGTLSVGSIDSLYVKAISVSVIFIVAFLVGSIAVVKNRDVR